MLGVLEVTEAFRTSSPGDDEATSRVEVVPLPSFVEDQADDDVTSDGGYLPVDRVEELSVPAVVPPVSLVVEVNQPLLPVSRVGEVDQADNQTSGGGFPEVGSPLSLVVEVNQPLLPLLLNPVGEVDQADDQADGSPEVTPVSPPPLRSSSRIRRPRILFQIKHDRTQSYD